MGADTIRIPEAISINTALFAFGDGVCVPVVKWIADNYLTPLAAAPALLGVLYAEVGTCPPTISTMYRMGTTPRKALLETSALIVGYAMSRLDTEYLAARGYRSWKAAFADAGKLLNVARRVPQEPAR